MVVPTPFSNLHTAPIREARMDPTPKLLTTQELATAWNVDRSFVYRLCQRQELDFVKLGSAIRIREDVAAAWLAKNTIPAATS